ncbi:zona pellucida sperm-binding protein 2-like [Grus japonensis]|uniref:Zona pellucida sperm-binding protein 2-like n=1 Tax=Grus japonensis TaxID=30415 RepID=A0ABC9WJ60_GRUJA
MGSQVLAKPKEEEDGKRQQDEEYQELEHLTGSSALYVLPPGFIESSCHSRIFWMKLNKLLLQGKFFQLEINDPYAGPILLDKKLASRCGYVLSEDVWGNPVFRASVLGCHVANEADELFSLIVNIKVSSFSSMRAAVTYTYPMYCSYSSWASREIVCEENYMETQNVAYQLWQLMFVSPSGRKTITVSDAAKLGYSFNNTLSRVYLRAPYHSNESDVSMVSGVNMNMVTSTSMYRQRWLLLLIDTTVSCPVDTLPEERLFNVAFGHFLPDVSLVAIAIGNVPFTLREAQHHRFKIYETPFSNRTKGFILEVSFDDPYVLKEYVNRNETKYTLLINYTISVGPEMTLYYHSAEVECVIADIELPEAVGSCDEENLYLAIPTFGLHQYWNLYLGNKLLNRHVAVTNGYLPATNSTHLILQIPLFAVGVTYEEVSFQKIKARFDVTLRKVRTMETLQKFSVSCNFNSSAFIICHPDGTIMVSAQMKTVPAIDMSKTKLRDRSCKPREYNEGHAFFKFHVTTCGTSVKVELKDKSPHAKLYLENCWVTRSPDFNSTPRWNITVDGQVVIE